MRRTTLLVILAALAAAAPSQARDRPATTGSWATVNLCDTAAHPNQIGIRGSMPGLKRKSRMTMRFRVQYLDDGRWRFIRTGADSGQQPVAVAKGGQHDSGWTFEFKPPASGGAHVLRGFVQFEWRRGGRVLQRDRVTTQPGHPGTAGADPEDFSAKTCEIA